MISVTTTLSTRNGWSIRIHARIRVHAESERTARLPRPRQKAHPPRMPVPESKVVESSFRKPSVASREGGPPVSKKVVQKYIISSSFLIYKIECREGTRSTRRGISRPGGGSGGAQSSPESRRCPAAGGSESKPGKRDARQDLRQHAPQGVYGDTAQGATPVSAPAAAPAPPPGGGGLTSTRSAGCTSWTGTRPWTWPAPRRAAAAPASAGTSARTPGWGSSGRTPRRSGRC